MAGYTLSTNEEAGAKIAFALSQLAKGTEAFESVANTIRDHKESWYVKPEDKGYADAVEIFVAAAKEEQEIVNPQRVFDYRPNDGAHATAKVLFDVWGYAGFGKTIPASMFSPARPPEKHTINVGPNETLEIPWGWLAVPDLKATLKLGAVRDPEKGILFQLVVECPKLMEKSVKGLFLLIENELKKNSIYKGKAITAAQEPDFIDLSRLKPNEVIFAEPVQQALEHEVWFAIENMDLMSADNQPTRWVTMLDGKYGTGKTLASMLTALRCQQNGITFIQVRPGTDDLKSAMQTAVLYAPAVVAFEDVDTVADPTRTSETEISRLLEAFDGIRSKGANVQVILTTNHSDKVHAGLLRAGRLHTYIKFGDLDADALAQLIKVKVGNERLEDFDQAAVYEACKHYEPAFMDLVIQVARRYALSRNVKKWQEEHKGEKPSKRDALKYKISTIDLGSAAQRLRAQHELMMSVVNKAPKDSFEKMFGQLIRRELDGMPLVDSEGDFYGHIKSDEVKRADLVNASK